MTNFGILILNEFVSIKEDYATVFYRSGNSDDANQGRVGIESGGHLDGGNASIARANKNNLLRPYGFRK